MNRAQKIIQGLLLLFVLMILASMLFPIFARNRNKAHDPSCLHNQREIGITMMLYAQDHDGHLPAASTVWHDVYLPSDALMCPAAGDAPISYGYSLYLSDRALGKLADPLGTPLCADSDNPQHLLVIPSDFAPRHGEGHCIVTFTDGHAKYCAIADLRLQPKLK